MSDLASRTLADAQDTLEAFIMDIDAGLVTSADLHRVSTIVFRALAIKQRLPGATLTPGRPNPKQKDIAREAKRHAKATDD